MAPSSSPKKPRWRTLTSRTLDQYKTISDYGIIGDQRTCALVGIDGSIDWLCVPAFDSPSVFGALLDRRRGGSFEIRPDSSEFDSMQHYDGLTNVLVTEFRNDSGRVRLTDFMPCFRLGELNVSAGEVHRRLSGVSGKMKVRVTVRPRPDYGSRVPRVEEWRGGGYSFLPKESLERQELALSRRSASRWGGARSRRS